MPKIIDKLPSSIKIRTLILQFDYDLELDYEQINAFRQKAIGNVRGSESIWDNHLKKTKEHGQSENNFSYPKIHYRSYNGKATIFGLEQGLLAMQTKRSILEKAFGEAEAIEQKHEIGLNESLTIYTIREYCPFNQNNAKKFKNRQSDEEVLDLLKTCLTNNLKSLMVTFDLKHLKNDIKVEIMGTPNYLDTKKIPYNERCDDIYTFQIAFATNIAIAEHLAIGKFVSKGTGIIMKATDDDIKQL